MAAAVWYESPPQFEGLVNQDANRLLGYLLLSKGAAAHVRRLADRQHFPKLTEDFVRDVQTKAVENARRKLTGQTRDKGSEVVADQTHDAARTLFASERHVCAAGNRFLQNAFFQVRAERRGPPEILGEAEDTVGSDHDDEPGPEMGGLRTSESSRIRSAITLAAGGGGIRCVHPAPGAACTHRRGPCPNPAVVLCVALQLVAWGEGVRPPVAGLDSATSAVSEKAVKYAIVSVASPGRVRSIVADDGGDRTVVPDDARQVVRRCWHCALELLRSSQATR
jgi:hypothetical protein